MKPESLEATKTVPLAMSVAVPMRPIGMRFNVCWPDRFKVVCAHIACAYRKDRSPISVSIIPGCIELT